MKLKNVRRDEMKTIVIVSILAAIFAIIIVANAGIANENSAMHGKQLNIIVGFRDGIPQDIDDNVKAHGAAVVSKNKDINFMVVDPKSRNADDLIAEMQKHPKVEYVEYDHIATAFFTPNDISYPSQWGPQDIFAPQAWDITNGSHNVIIAIVDSGVDYNHPDIAPNYCVGGYDFINNDADPVDDNGHGTHVAGIAAGVTNNGLGIAGISQSCIMAEKVLGSTGSGSYSAVANGITHAANNGARVISMSLGGRSSSDTLKAAVNYAWNKGVLIVAAAGNDNSGKISYPAAYSNVIAVSALDNGDRFAYYSNHGSKIELAAPGTNIYSTLKDGGYGYMDGTSMATPFVSGTAALVLSKNNSLTNQQVKNILDTTAVDLGRHGKDPYYGYGKVNAYGALLNTP